MIEVLENQSLSEWTSWLVGGQAEFYVAPKTLDELKEAMLWAHSNQKEITLLGGGTNTLVSDQGVPGLVIHTHKLNQTKVVSENEELLIEAEAGAQKSEVLKYFMKYRLAPAVFLAGLPGDMAGGVVMNAGVGHKVEPKEFCEIVKKIEVFEIKNDKVVEKSISSDELEWQYRKSLNWQPGIISRVWVAWPMQADDEVLKRVREGNKRRKDTQPLTMPSCGSVFKNPEGDHAGRLIEASGLKGFQMGGAQVSEKHANFIVNTGTATAEEIHQVIEKVQSEVFEKHQIKLTNEVVYLGLWDHKN